VSWKKRYASLWALMNNCSQENPFEIKKKKEPSKEKDEVRPAKVKRRRRRARQIARKNNKGGGKRREAVIPKRRAAARLPYLSKVGGGFTSNVRRGGKNIKKVKGNRKEDYNAGISKLSASNRGGRGRVSSPENRNEGALTKHTERT